MDDSPRIKDQFYILARSSLTDERTRVLKFGDTFGVFDPLGDIESDGLGEHGIYHRGTRHISRFAVRLGDQIPQLLRSGVRQDNSFLSMDMMNVDVSEDGGVSIPRGSIHLFRSQFIWKGVCYQQLRVSNYALQEIEAVISCEFDADFADIFEVRGTQRKKRGKVLPIEVSGNHVVISYKGRDRKLRRSILGFSPEPDELSKKEARFKVKLEPKRETSLYFSICCEWDAEQKDVLSFSEALDEMTESVEQDGCRLPDVFTSNRGFGAWIARSHADLHMMIAGNPERGYPYAGVPWFNSVFGRDGILTAMECLWLAPWMAKSVLLYLAENQATKSDREAEADPGKILHEMRRGEMATLREVPFGKYYGSVDTTPLFVMLAGAYWQRTHDLEFLQTIWPNILLAVKWIDDYGDLDGDGFVEYKAKSRKGLAQQGWKDSHDAISHSDGSLADSPVALCEVQGYVYAAKLGLAPLAEALGDGKLCRRLLKESAELQQKFEEKFWDNELQSYALALDGSKEPCRVLASNAGHCLFTGIASNAHAAAVMNTLLGKELFCGWGVRTLGSGEKRYNPMAYHNGSVWPHDNAIIARGFSRYGFYEEAQKITTALFDATAFMEHRRLPELFCGFHRRPGEGPTLYPVACSPQAWASGAVYLLLEACLGIEVQSGRRIRFAHPYLPDLLNDLRIEGLHLDDEEVKISVKRDDNGETKVHASGRNGGLPVQTGTNSDSAYANARKA